MFGRVLLPQSLKQLFFYYAPLLILVLPDIFV